MNLEGLDGLQVFVGENDDIYDMMSKNPGKYVNIRERTNLQYELYKHNVAHYLPPSFKDSDFFLELDAICFKKNFAYVEIFNF